MSDKDRIRDIAQSGGMEWVKLTMIVPEAYACYCQAEACARARCNFVERWFRE